MSAPVGLAAGALLGAFGATTMRRVLTREEDGRSPVAAG
jgi:hypothetical protein